MDEIMVLRRLARAMGVHTRYTDGLGKRIVVAPDTLLRVCATLGAPIGRPVDAADALRAHRAGLKAERLPPVLVAWDGVLAPLASDGRDHGAVQLSDGEVIPLERIGETLHTTRPLPNGYHRLTLEARGRLEACTVIAAPVQAWRRPGAERSWGVGAHLAALRSARSRSLGDLKDLALLCDWVRRRGGDLVTALPLLPTFNTDPAEPSPYSPVSRLFWSELILDLGDGHRPTAAPDTLDVIGADAEVRAALAGRPAPLAPEGELGSYARFRGAQAKMGRNWRDWPAQARAGVLEAHQVDAEVERFHLVAQTLLRGQ